MESRPQTVETRVFLRPIGSPLTLAMAGLAIASFVESGLDLGWISTGQTAYVGLIMLAVPFVLQIIACIFCYLARDASAATSVGILATGWLAFGLIQIVAPPSHPTGGLGLLLLAVAGLLVCSSLAVGLAKPLPAAVFLLAAVRFVLAGIYHLNSNGSVQDAAGVVGLVVTGLAAYCALAFELEGQMRQPVLPTFRRGSGETAISGGLAEQVAEVANEAGVRQMS